MKPTQGKQYTTTTGDNLKTISSLAYGNPEKWPLIKDVNQTQLTQDFTEEIPAGTVLIIPFDTELKNLRNEQLKAGLG